QTGERQRITSQYLLGIDGASSTVRRALGLAMIGEDGSTQRAFMGGTMLSFFIRSPTLLVASKRPPTNMTWILNPEMRGMMYAQAGRGRFHASNSGSAVRSAITLGSGFTIPSCSPIDCGHRCGSQGKERRSAVNLPPAGFPALVLNADFRPLSYYPLSLWSW